MIKTVNSEKWSLILCLRVSQTTHETTLAADTDGLDVSRLL